MGREYGSLAKQVVESIGVFCLTETGRSNIYDDNDELYFLSVILENNAFNG